MKTTVKVLAQVFFIAVTCAPVIVIGLILEMRSRGVGVSFIKEFYYYTLGE